MPTGERRSSWSPTARPGRAGCAAARTPASRRRSPRRRGSPTRPTERSLEAGLVGRSEREVAARGRGANPRARRRAGVPDDRRRRGRTARFPHAEPSEREIRAGELVVWDMGARLDGYCSDCTRTFAAGEPGEPRRARSTSSSAVPRRRDSRRSGPGVGGRRGRRGRPGDHPRGRPRGGSSGTGSGTGSGSRSTRRRGSARAPRTCSSPATWSRSSPGSTYRGGSGSGSRTWWWSPPRATAT